MDLQVTPGFVHPQIPWGKALQVLPGPEWGVFAAAISIANYYYSLLEQSPGAGVGFCPCPPTQPALHRSGSCSLLFTFACCLQLQFSDKNQLITFLELAMKRGYIKLH